MSVIHETSTSENNIYTSTEISKVDHEEVSNKHNNTSQKKPLFPSFVESHTTTATSPILTVNSSFLFASSTNLPNLENETGLAVPDISIQPAINVENLGNYTTTIIDEPNTTPINFITTEQTLPKHGLTTQPKIYSRTTTLPLSSTIKEITNGKSSKTDL